MNKCNLMEVSNCIDELDLSDKFPTLLQVPEMSRLLCVKLIDKDLKVIVEISKRDCKELIEVVSTITVKEKIDLSTYMYLGTLNNKSGLLEHFYFRRVA